MSSIERFVMRKVSRADIKTVDWNPRRIGGAAKKRLARGLNEVGLVQPLVWNERTGNLIGGHQRLAILDDMEGSTAYELTVSAVDVDEKTERRLNVLLNNEGTMGSWDESKLIELIQAMPDEAGQFDFDAFGFADGDAAYIRGLSERMAADEAAIASELESGFAFEEHVRERAEERGAEAHEKKLSAKERYEQHVDKLLKPAPPKEDWKLDTDEKRKEFDELRTAYKSGGESIVSLRVVADSLEEMTAWLAQFDVAPGRTLHVREMQRRNNGHHEAGRGEGSAGKGEAQ